MGKSDALSQQADHGSGSDDNWDLTLLQPELFTIWALQGVTFEGAEHKITCDIRQGICAGATEDAVTQAIKGLVRSKGKSLHADE